MNGDNLKDDQGQEPQESKGKEKPVVYHNPLNENDPKVYTQEDIDNEQKLKEALTERD